MAFTINGATVQFDADVFSKRVKKDGGWTHRWKTSSMTRMRDLSETLGNGLLMLEALHRVPLDKGNKYDRAIRYMIFHYPGLIPPGDLTTPPDPKVRIGTNPIRFDFGRALIDRGDLCYGTDKARQLQPYKMQGKRPRFCDDFNNAARIGTGSAFKRDWQGRGDLSATPESTEERIRDTISDSPVKTPSSPITADRFREYANGLLNSRYSPVGVYDLPRTRVGKDTTQEMTYMRNMYKNKKTAERQYWAHARFVKAVRRACKGGIAMVASSPLYEGAIVHFILDRLRDLGTMAMKKELVREGKGDYVPITSSELCFCFRYWDDVYDRIRFYVNGEMVIAPWLGNWSLPDANGNAVRSNQEAWLRYALYRDVTGKANKAFPEWDADEAVA